ncbi:MAG: cupredoxin domain-containing protein [Gemmatimonadetes bacterium]|nr:cupredoxin domain-containing protein [Gemmatimonadota bacterium]
MRRSTWRFTAALAAALPALAAFAPRGAPAAPPPAVHEVHMVMQGTTPRFVPAAITIHPGDQVRFTVVGTGGPHNVSFDTTTVPADVRRVLAAAMANQIQPLWGPLLTNPGESYTISFAGVKPGRYEFFCMPHMAMGMKGVITVR